MILTTMVEPLLIPLPEAVVLAFNQAHTKKYYYLQMEAIFYLFVGSLVELISGIRHLHNHRQCAPLGSDQ